MLLSLKGMALRSGSLPTASIERSDGPQLAAELFCTCTRKDHSVSCFRQMVQLRHHLHGHDPGHEHVEEPDVLQAAHVRAVRQPRHPQGASATILSGHTHAHTHTHTHTHNLDRCVDTHTQHTCAHPHHSPPPHRRRGTKTTLCAGTVGGPVAVMLPWSLVHFT